MISRLLCRFGWHKHGPAIGAAYVSYPNGLIDITTKVVTFRCACGDVLHGLMVHVGNDQWVTTGKPWRPIVQVPTGTGVA